MKLIKQPAKATKQEKRFIASLNEGLKHVQGKKSKCTAEKHKRS